MRKKLEVERSKDKVKWGWLAGIVILISTGMVLREWNKSAVAGSNNKYNLVMVAPNAVTFVSVDPIEKQVFILPFPSKMEIRSRSVGTYEVGKLYTLGSYDGEPGEFARQKVQGFMKTLINGYVVDARDAGKISKTAIMRDLARVMWRGNKISNLSRLDAGIILSRVGRYDYREASPDELVRSGVWEEQSGKFVYNEGRLQEYLGARIFDWGIGSEGITAVVINESTEAGLASDIAKFLSNAGIDVIAVRNGTEEKEVTEILVDSKAKEARLAPWLTGFGWTKVSIGDTSEWRADLVVRLGKDGLSLF